MSELNISQIVLELLKKYSSETVNTDNLDKTAHSKNITVSEWNELVKRYSVTAADVERIYSNLQNIANLLDTAVNGKLDSQTTPNSLYGTAADGKSTMYARGYSVNPSWIVQRDANGDILISDNPKSDNAAISVKILKENVTKLTTALNKTITEFTESVNKHIEDQSKTLSSMEVKLSSKLDQRATPSRVYCTLSNGTQSMVGWGVPVNPKTLAQRTDLGNLRVPNIPNADDEATSKYFVTSLNDRLSKRVSNLENLNISYSVDDTTAKCKQVPSGVKTEQALLKTVYGAKGPSKNVVDPYTLTFFNGAFSDIADPVSVQYNADGTLTYTVGPYPSYYCDVTLPSPGKYYVYVNKPHFIEYSYSTLRYGYFLIDCQADFDSKLGENGEYLKTTRTLEVMVWKDPEYVTDEYVVEEAPEDTVFEPYGSFQPVKTLSIDSYGSQIIPFPYRKDNATYGPGYSQTINGLTYTVLEDGGIHVKGTATAYSTFTFCNKRENFPLEPGYTYYLNKGVVITYNDAATGATNVRWASSALYWEPSYTIRNVYIAYPEGAVKDEIIYPMMSIGYSEKPYAKYVGLLDSLEIPESVHNLEGFGRYGSVLEFDISGKATLTVYKDIFGKDLETPVVYDVSNDFLRGSFIKVTPGGTVRFKTDLDAPIPSDLWYATVKE